MDHSEKISWSFVSQTMSINFKQIVKLRQNFRKENKRCLNYTQKRNLTSYKEAKFMEMYMYNNSKTEKVSCQMATDFFSYILLCTSALVDSGCAFPPNGTQFFRFRIHFAENPPALESYYTQKDYIITRYSGGSRISRRGGGRGSPMLALFGENVCENERIGSCRGWHAPGTPPLDLPMRQIKLKQLCSFKESCLTV